jgi:heterodisulfide reductase subunit A-like polyferredoxin
MDKKIVIIGSGVSGISAAITKLVDNGLSRKPYY